ncbi:peroxisomal targeting signal 1 receptor [Leptopilina heterotoma]|uniref:peroxisomal targeting signal 1 receptor n=1 Tax=Leptopilina heterotoma TaxID=63436 RepID=UPI001CA8D739|nr:peroxisomal targeting signal 1 receptor [Leptopilina heterotoma]XP_043466645.1 peroxisomal targeting signal 1 receptor [Leptopilina heterotoma]
MAFRDLVESDCGGLNPLMRFTSHFVQDHGFKEDGVHDHFDSREPFESTSSDQLVKQFLEENSMHPQTFKMDHLLQEMREIDQNVYPPVMSPCVAKELTGQDTAWATQYLQSGKHFDENHAEDIWNSPAIERPMATKEPLTFIPGETYELGLGPKWAEEYLEQNIENAEDNEKKSEELTESVNLEEPNIAYSKFMKFMRQEESNSIEQKNKWSSEFIEEKIINDAVDDEEDDAVAELSKENSVVLNKVEEELSIAGTWVDEFNKTVAKGTDNYESSFWKRLQGEWDKILSSENISATHPWISEYNTYYDPFKEYKFNENNPMSNLANAFEEGKKRLAIGDLPSAVLCFEAAVTQDNNNVEAWLLLGKTQAENEQDSMAISALKQCLTLDPANSAALMSLAVSYTNESFQSQACLTLKEWLLKNEKYKHLTPLTPFTQPTQTRVSTILFNDVHNEVKDLFIQAARLQPSETIDPDVQCGLGVLFNLSSEYNKAADCFRAAIQARPDDAKLWNRLGATLANGQRSEEAIDAYHHALDLSPGFIRARYNLGISCINLGAYKEAGEHLLTALNQQAAGRNLLGEKAPPKAMSDTIWSTLRLVVSLMHKFHLNEAIENRDLATLNNEFEME